MNGHQMKIYVKIFPIAGVSDAAQEMEVTLAEGKLSELITLLQNRIGSDLSERSIMLLHNGQSLNIDDDVILTEGDRVWAMPRLSGG